jgi:hypothetical protein
VIGRQSGKVFITLIECKSQLNFLGLAIKKTLQAIIDILVSLLGLLSSHEHTLAYDKGPEIAQNKL